MDYTFGWSLNLDSCSHLGFFDFDDIWGKIEARSEALLKKLKHFGFGCSLSVNLYSHPGFFDFDDIRGKIEARSEAY